MLVNCLSISDLTDFVHISNVTLGKKSLQIIRTGLFALYSFVLVEFLQIVENIVK